jgi:hypothetical protein
MRGVKTRAGNRWKKMLLSLSLVLILGILLNSVNNVYKKKKGAEELLTRMQGEIKTLEDREVFLTESLDRLSTVEGMKFEIRKKLNVAEVGESVAIIVAQEETGRTTPSKLSAWQQIKLFFTKLFD